MDGLFVENRYYQITFVGKATAFLFGTSFNNKIGLG